MKKILLPLLLFPFSVFAQEVTSDSAASKAMKWEVGFNNSIAFTAEGNSAIYDDIYLAGRNSLSVYRNFSGAQIGLVVEGGLLGVGEGWWVSPQAVVNYKVQFRKFYAYGGGVAGYVREDRGDGLVLAPMNGFVSGAHGGVVYGLGKRFGLNLQGGVRFQHMSGKVIVEDPTFSGGTASRSARVGYTDMYFPVSVGVRYRF